jgi:hypothetical protein
MVAPDCVWVRTMPRGAGRSRRGSVPRPAGPSAATSLREVLIQRVGDILALVYKLSSGAPNSRDTEGRITPTPTPPPQGPAAAPLFLTASPVAAQDGRGQRANRGADPAFAATKRVPRYQVGGSTGGAACRPPGAHGEGADGKAAFVRPMRPWEALLAATRHAVELREVGDFPVDWPPSVRYPFIRG